MNATNRVLNRAFVLVIGLLSLGLGAVAVALVAVPDFLRGWEQTAPSVTGTLSAVLADTALAGTGMSWVPLAGLAAAAVLVLTLAVFIARQGHGRTHRLITAAPTEDGTTIVDGAVAEQMLTADLRERAEFDAVAVSTHEVHGEPVLKVSAAVRHGVAARDAITVIERSVHGLDSLLGAEIPVLVQLNGGTGSRRSRRRPVRPSVSTGPSVPAHAVPAHSVPAHAVPAPSAAAPQPIRPS